MFWGITPSIDLIDEYENCTGKIPDTINILLIGAMDCRHVLKTLARRYRHKSVKINFYLIEACMENVAKQLLLLNIALQPLETMGLDQKTKIFMELYGNTLIRPSVAKFLISASTDMVNMITDYEYLKNKISCVNLDIKYKERDYLENLLKFWCGKEEFNIVECWDKRLRQQLGVRYDSRAGSFDWDLYMRFHTMGGNHVCGQEYKSFRTNGLAFSWLESEVSIPNRTMVCAIFQNGEKFAHHGYVGDIRTGPFVPFGLDCEDKSFLKSQHGQNSYRATDITERNIKQIFYEIQYGEEYQHQKTNDIELGTTLLKQDKLIIDVKAVHIVPRKMKQCIQLVDISINYLSIDSLDMMQFKPKYENMFDIIYFGAMYLKFLDKKVISKIGKNGSLLIIENQRFILSNRNKDLEKHGEDIKNNLEGVDAEVIAFDILKDDHIKYLLKK